MGRIVWVDASAGVAGDMLAGALVDAGVPLEVLQSAVRAVLPEATLTAARVERNGLAAVKFDVTANDDQPHRHLDDILRMLAGADIADDVRDMATRVFARLADVEAAAHGTDVNDVHFHEVGAVDSIADIVAVCAALHHIGFDELSFGVVELGTGIVRAAHGELPVPTPAALRLSQGIVVQASARGECATPTGLALLTALGSQRTQLPQLRVTATGLGAGTRERPDRANVVRVVIGDGVAEDHVVLAEANVDDMDPRLWPRAIELLMAAGADDVWLTPILMKKGRPAQTLSLLCKQSRLAELQQLVFEHTTTIGMRILEIDKLALERKFDSVRVDGEVIGIKIAGRAGRILNVSIEYSDVAAAALKTGRAERDVLQQAETAALVAGYGVGGVFEAD